MLYEIKFKAKRLDTKEWVYGYFVKYPDGKSVIFSEGQFEGIGVDENTLCQSTGEVDIDFKELFIGDVVNDFGGGVFEPDPETGNYIETSGNNTRLGIIVFEEGRTCIRTKEMSYSYNLSNASRLNDMQYVRNIYDE